MAFAQRRAPTPPVRRRWPLRTALPAGLALLALALIVLVVGAIALGPPPPDRAVAAPAARPTPTASSEPAPGAPAPSPLPMLIPLPTAAPTTTPATALEAARSLPVKGRAPKTGYERKLFGEGWVDTDHDGCDPRNEILARDLTDVTFREGTGNCVVLSGTLLDPYSGGTIAFLRGEATSAEVQIDHVVALGDAWQKGAQAWDTATRIAFTNDPLNLQAVDGALNLQKGDADTATWLPPNKAFRCEYVARQVAVKDRYGLWVTQAEQDAMVRVLNTCPDEPLPE